MLLIEINNVRDGGGIQSLAIAREVEGKPPKTVKKVQLNPTARCKTCPRSTNQNKRNICLASYGGIEHQGYILMIKSGGRKFDSWNIPLNFGGLTQKRQISFGPNHLRIRRDLRSVFPLHLLHVSQNRLSYKSPLLENSRCTKVHVFTTSIFGGRDTRSMLQQPL
jgi:hypothetical protein